MNTSIKLAYQTPRAAYLHVPFCIHRCGYCNFTLITDRDDLIETYLQAIEQELAGLKHPQQVDTLYFGGGTPTYLQPDALHQLCQVALKWFPLAEGYEWTVEANPGDLDRERIQVLREAGVNRLSLGAQSFRTEKLKLLERDHQADDIYSAVELARSAGMQIAIDLIFAAPGETLLQWEDDLNQLMQLSPEHVSTYGLTFEQGTSFWSRRNQGKLVQAGEDLEREMYLLGIETLQSANFQHYEISNFSQPGFRSRHNETYWSGNGYFAAGPGSARFVDGVRETNHSSTTTYIKRVLAGESAVAEREVLSPEQLARELLVFGLRRLEGVAYQQFENQTGFSIEELAGSEIDKFVEAGMLANQGDTIRLTRDGLLVSDAIWPDLL